jgi:hypothetical protein
LSLDLIDQVSFNRILTVSSKSLWTRKLDQNGFN